MNHTHRWPEISEQKRAGGTGERIENSVFSVSHTGLNFSSLIGLVGEVDLFVSPSSAGVTCGSPWRHHKRLRHLPYGLLFMHRPRHINQQTLTVTSWPVIFCGPI